MFEKVNPSHPDKVADRIAGALVDAAYSRCETPRIAVEVLIGHGVAHVIVETDVELDDADVASVVRRIAGPGIETDCVIVPQDADLAANQSNGVRCGDNGIFRGSPVTAEQRWLSAFARDLYLDYASDGKMVRDRDRLIVCQSQAESEELRDAVRFCGPDCDRPFVVDVNPLGYWTGGTDTDTGATNRKLGSDLGDAVTGGGLHGKDLSKADVTLTIWAHIVAQVTGEAHEVSCAIGDVEVDGLPYSALVDIARLFVNRIGGFEALAEWGLI